MISTEILETKGPNIVRRIHLNARILPLTSKIWCRCWCCGRNLQAIRIVIQFACALKSWNDRIERSTLSVWRSEAHLILERRRFHLARCEYANSVDTVDTTHTHTLGIPHTHSPNAHIMHVQYLCRFVRCVCRTLCLLSKTTIYFIYYILCLNNIIAHYAAFVELCARGTASKTCNRSF